MMVVRLGQQYHVGEKPTVILYTYYIDRHAGMPDKTKPTHMNSRYNSFMYVPVSIENCRTSSSYQRQG